MSNRPHILIIMPDQHRTDCMSCAGHPVIRTPNMDRLAAEGMRFPRATTTSPLCMPARASFISGLYPHQMGMWDNCGSLPADDATFFQTLQRSGYRTAHIGKSHYYPHAPEDHLRNHEPYMHARGFDYVHETTGPHATRRTDSYMTDHWERLGLLDRFRDDYNERVGREGPFAVRPSPLPWEEFYDSYVGRQVIEYVERFDEDRPTCLYVGFPGPHEPWDAPEPYASMYRPEDMPPAIDPEEGAEWLSEAVRGKMRDGRYPASLLTSERIAAIRANYCGKITLIDHWIGRILEAYERKGWLDEALVMYFSDHGEMAGDHGRIGKQVFFHGSLDIPFIVRWPGRVPAGVISDALVQQIDLYRTILELVGLEVPDRVAGKSLVPVFRNPEQRLRETAFSEVSFKRRYRTLMAQTDRFKYVMDQTGEGIDLFDEQDDPEERRNLVGRPDYGELERDMREHVLRFLVREQVVL